MKMIWLTSFAVGLSALTPAMAAPLHPAQQQVQKNIDNVLSVAKNSSLNEQQKLKRIENYADNYLDYQRITAYAVGNPWRQFTPKQKTDFTAAFKNMVISLYARSALMDAQGASVKLLPKFTDNGNKVVVYSEVKTPSGNRYEVGYRLYSAGKVYKLYDIQVDGSSLVTVYRGQFGELIRKEGVNGAIQALKDKRVKAQ